jgi:ribonuclease BN (tRNA processing enzyme)
MKLTVLGCSGSVPGPDSPASSYLVESQGFRVLLDLGPGAFGALQRYVSPEQIDAIVISHLHVDHFIDLTAMATYLKYSGNGSNRRMTVIGPSDTQERLTLAYAGRRSDLDFSDIFDFQTSQDGIVGSLEMKFARTRHPIETYAVRLNGERESLTYSADTGPSEEVIELARGTNMFLCEASFGPEDSFVPNLHLSGAQAGEHAARADVGRLVVTHVPPWHSRDVAVSEAMTTFGGPIVAAAADDVYEV